MANPFLFLDRFACRGLAAEALIRPSRERRYLRWGYCWAWHMGPDKSLGYTY
jgi:hypothetical protein